MQESDTTALRHLWIDSINRVKLLKPKIVIPSHKQASDGFGVNHLDNTKRFIVDWDEQAKVWVLNKVVFLESS
jgi:hypothetical protein